MSKGDKGDDVFLRDASGVVRNVKMSDTFIYNAGLINAGIGIAFILLLGPAFYQAANLSLAVGITAVFCSIQALTYYFFSVSMPRSGGVYTFLSRSLHPVIGFVMSFNMAFWLLFFSAVSATYLGNLGLAPFFTVLGDATGIGMFSQWGTALTPAPGTFLSGTLGTFLIGTGAIVLSIAILITGMRQYFRVQLVAMIIAFLGIFTLIAVLFTTSQESFVTSFNQFTDNNLTYQAVIETARGAGWADSESSLSTTLAFMVWPFYPLAFSIMSSSFAGEIKDVEKSQLYGMPGAVITSAVLFILVTVGAYQTIGYDFLGAIGYNFYFAPEGATSAVPWIGLLGSIASENLLLTILIGLAFVMWTWFWVPGCMLYGTRVMLAWSMDRVGPDALGSVSSKYNTPVTATIVAGVMAELLLIAYIFVPATQALVGIGAMGVSFAATGLGAIFFPYRRPEMFENSPVNYRVAGVPVMSILGLLTFGYMSLMVYYFFTDPLIGASNPIAIGIGVGVFVVAGLFYYGMRYYRKRQGIDVDRAFDEIPVE
jgi:amino acid transporter